MFTGLVETIGVVEHTEEHADSKTFVISAPSIMHDVGLGDSIAVNGCCLTVNKHTAQDFTVTAIRETLQKTTLGAIAVADRVNLERAVAMGTRLGGHLVSGHIDTTGTVVEMITNHAGAEVWIEYPATFRNNLIPVGSVCVDGISLTVAALANRNDDYAMVKAAIIPHTLAVTTIGRYAIGTTVNLEFDLVGKYILQAGGYSR